MKKGNPRLKMANRNFDLVFRHNVIKSSFLKETVGVNSFEEDPNEQICPQKVFFIILVEKFAKNRKISCFQAILT